MYLVAVIIYDNTAISLCEQNDRVKIVRMFLPCYTIEIEKLYEGIKVDPMHFNILQKTKVIKRFICILMCVQSWFCLTVQKYQKVNGTSGYCGIYHI
jgi:hypothetical protein